MDISSSNSMIAMTCSSSSFGHPYDEIEVELATNIEEEEQEDTIMNTNSDNSSSPFATLSNLVASMSGSLLLGDDNHNNKENSSSTTNRIIHDEESYLPPPKETVDVLLPEEEIHQENEQEYDNLFGYGFSQSFDKDAYHLQTVVAEGWVHLKGSGQDWCKSRSWKPRYAKLAWAQVVGYQRQIPLLMIYWYQHSSEPSTVIVLDSTVVVPLDKPDKDVWNAHCFEIIHTTSSAKRITRVMTAGTFKARNEWVFTITQTMIQYEKEKHLSKQQQQQQQQQQKSPKQPRCPSIYYEDRFVSSQDILPPPQNYYAKSRCMGNLAAAAGFSYPQDAAIPQLSLLPRPFTSTTMSAPTSPLQEQPLSPLKKRILNYNTHTNHNTMSSPPLSPTTTTISNNFKSNKKTSSSIPPLSPTSPRSFTYHPRTSAFTPPSPSISPTQEHSSITWEHPYYHHPPQHQQQQRRKTQTRAPISTTTATTLPKLSGGSFTPVSPSPTNDNGTSSPMMTMMAQSSITCPSTDGIVTPQVIIGSSDQDGVGEGKIVDTPNSAASLLSPPSIRNTHLHRIDLVVAEEQQLLEETNTITRPRRIVISHHHSTNKVLDTREHNATNVMQKQHHSPNPLLFLPQDESLLEEEEDTTTLLYHRPLEHEEDENEVGDTIYTDDEDEDDLLVGEPFVI